MDGRVELRLAVVGWGATSLRRPVQTAEWPFKKPRPTGRDQLAAADTTAPRCAPQWRVRWSKEGWGSQRRHGSARVRSVPAPRSTRARRALKINIGEAITPSERGGTLFQCRQILPCALPIVEPILNRVSLCCSVNSASLKRKHSSLTAFRTQSSWFIQAAARKQTAYAGRCTAVG